MNQVEQVFVTDIVLEDAIIRNTIDGISCSHNNYKKLCMKCMQHYSKDYKFHHAMYEINKRYLESPFCVVCNQRINVGNPLQMKEGFFHRVCWIKQTQVRLRI